MKTTVLLSFVLAVILISNIVLSQNNVPQLLDDASASYEQGSLENARFTLQEALNGINQAIGKGILEKLPESIGGMEKVAESDNVTGTNMGFAGLYVNRDYQSETGDLNFQIISDSPMLSAISSMLSMSVFMAADPNQKRIKLDGYKALLTKSEDETGDVSFDVQLPFGNSLMTFAIHGKNTTDEVEELLEAIPISEIIEIAQ
ncbi:MAG: hypothetical protein KQI35_08275 [Bacteroidetes bacterium]|nr:hypothetical protein [Bacteroidota bacterium]